MHLPPSQPPTQPEGAPLITTVFFKHIQVGCRGLQCCGELVRKMCLDEYAQKPRVLVACSVYTLLSAPVVRTASSRKQRSSPLMPLLEKMECVYALGNLRPREGGGSLGSLFGLEEHASSHQGPTDSQGPCPTLAPCANQRPAESPVPLLTTPSCPFPYPCPCRCPYFHHTLKVLQDCSCSCLHRILNAMPHHAMHTRSRPIPSWPLPASPMAETRSALPSAHPGSLTPLAHVTCVTGPAGPQHCAHRRGKDFVSLFVDIWAPCCVLHTSCSQQRHLVPQGGCG